MPLLRSLAPVAAAFSAASLTAFAANLAPELIAPLPALTLVHGATSAPITLTDHLRDPDVPGSAVRITTRIGAQTRVMDIALFDATAPLTVANFLAYVDAGRYAANFYHRSVPGFIIQNGGFRFLNDTTFDYVPTFAPVVNEFGASNLRGTVAMAKLGGDPDSATSQWFINLADNSANLDAQNGGFTVFGRVLGDGMAVADAIAALPRYNASSYASAWTDLPLTAGFLARENFIETSAARIAPLSFSVTSDDPTLVRATLSQGQLTLSVASDRIAAASTTIHVIATDLEGAVLETSFTVSTLPPENLAAWRQIHFATSANTGPAADTADPDGDGIPNLLEYALALDPSIPGRTGLPQPGRSADQLTLSYRRARADLSYTVQTTTDLAAPDSWTSAGVSPGEPDADQLVTASIALAGPRRFLRLHVSSAP